MALVKARYLGGSPVVFPHLVEELDGGPHAGKSAVINAAGKIEFRKLDPELAEGEQLLADNAASLVVTGDIIQIDKASAEGRDDLELIRAPKKAKKPSKPKAAAAAAEKE